MSWEDDAACLDVDPDAFFPEDAHAYRDIAAVKRVCAGCLVRDRCLQLGFQYDTGVFGGLSGNERRALTRKRAS